MATRFFTLRLPDDLREKLAEAAKKERRSLAGMLIMILEQYFKPEEK